MAVKNECHYLKLIFQLLREIQEINHPLTSSLQKSLYHMMNSKLYTVAFPLKCKKNED